MKWRERRNFLIFFAILADFRQISSRLNGRSSYNYQRILDFSHPVESWDPKLRAGSLRNSKKPKLSPRESAKGENFQKKIKKIPYFGLKTPKNHYKPSFFANFQLEKGFLHVWKAKIFDFFCNCGRF